MKTLYAQSVLNGAISIEQVRDLGSGRLRFNRAAHARMGSSQAIFKQMAEVLVRLLADQPESISEARLKEYLQL